jgi:hypothetical protein
MLLGITHNVMHHHHHHDNGKEQNAPATSHPDFMTDVI